MCLLHSLYLMRCVENCINRMKTLRKQKYRLPSWSHSWYLILNWLMTNKTKTLENVACFLHKFIRIYRFKFIRFSFVTDTKSIYLLFFMLKFSYRHKKQSGKISTKTFVALCNYYLLFVVANTHKCTTMNKKLFPLYGNPLNWIGWYPLTLHLITRN